MVLVGAEDDGALWRELFFDERAIVDAGGRLFGIVSYLDVIQALRP